jgi:DivIVA domain-containing protein
MSRRITPTQADAVTAASTPSPEGIEDREFGVIRRGYDTNEVRAFLYDLARALREQEREIERTRGDRSELERRLDQTTQQVRSLRAEVAEQRLRLREVSNRLELSEALREDGLTRIRAAEEGRRYAEQLLALVDARQADVDLRPDAQRTT